MKDAENEAVRVSGWRKFLTGRNGFLEATLILAGASLVSRLLGLFRDRIFASTFGAGDALDAYYAAFRLPDLIFNLLILGALSAAFIPVLSEYLTRGRREEAWELANSLLNVLLILVGVISVAIFIFAYPLTGVLTPGFDPEKRELVATLTRIMLLSPILFGASSIAGAVLNAYHRFTVYALAPILYNLGIILGALAFTPRFGVVGLAMGVVLGALLHFAVQTAAVRSLGFRYRPVITLREDLARIGGLMLPRAGALAVLQVYLLVEVIIASTLAAGSVAIINLASNLQTVVSGIVGLSIATAIFPTLARLASLSESEQFVRSLTKALRQTLYFTIPLGVLVILLRAQIVRVILGAGEFTWEDTQLTAAALGVFAVSLFAQSSVHLLNRAFYALQDTIQPLVASVASVGLNIVLAIFLARSYGVVGLAAAFSIASIFYMLILLGSLQRKVRIVRGQELGRDLIKMTAAAFVMALGTYATLYAVAPLVDMERAWGVLTQGLAAGFAGIAIYLAVSRILGLPESRYVLKWLRRKGPAPAPLS